MIVSYRDKRHEDLPVVVIHNVTSIIDLHDNQCVISSTTEKTVILDKEYVLDVLITLDTADYNK